MKILHKLRKKDQIQKILSNRHGIKKIEISPEYLDWTIQIPWRNSELFNTLTIWENFLILVFFITIFISKILLYLIGMYIQRPKNVHLRKSKPHPSSQFQFKIPWGFAPRDFGLKLALKISVWISKVNILWSLDSSNTNAKQF